MKQKTQSPLRLLGFITFAFGLLLSSAFGDGIYIPSKAYRKIPEVPAQRAILKWKDGVETLVISSTLDSESQELGWIIPLPSVPDTIEKETPGPLKTINFCLQPDITHEMTSVVRSVLFMVVFLNLVLAIILFRRESLWSFLLWLFLLMMIFGLCLGSLSSAGSSSGTRPGRLVAEKTASVGSYEIAILRPQKAEELSGWLSENEFASLPSKADSIMEAYIKDRWVFATIKLRRDEAGSNTPHPIRMSFRSQELIYPLMLTSLAGGSTFFELYVIGSERANCDLLKTEYCDRFNPWTSDSEGRGQEFESKTLYRGENARAKIGHQSLVQMMWPGCILTKLSGNIKSEQTTKDLRFKWETFKPQQEHYYTSLGATQTALVFFILLNGVWLFASLIMHRRRSEVKQDLYWDGWRFLPRAIAVTSVISILACMWFPKLADSEVEVRRSSEMLQRVYYYDLIEAITQNVDDHPEMLKKTEKEISEAILNAFASEDYFRRQYKRSGKALNYITGEPLVAEDGPGGFTIRKEVDAIILRVFDDSGRASRINLSDIKRATDR